MVTVHAVLGGKSLSQLTRLKAISISGDNYFSMESADGGWLTGLGRLTGLTSAKFYGFVDVRPHPDTLPVTCADVSACTAECSLYGTAALQPSMLAPQLPSLQDVSPSYD